MTKRLKVLVFSTLYPSSVRPRHGIFVATRVRHWLARDAAEAKVVAPVPWFPFTGSRFGSYAEMARTPHRETLDGLDVRHPRYVLPPKVGMTVAPLALAAGAADTLRRIVREGFDFDLIDAHYYYPDGVAAALLARWFDRPLVVTARGSDINLVAGYALPRRMMRWASRHAEASIAVSDALATAMAAAGFPSAKTRVLRNGVDLERFHAVPRAAARRRLGWPDEPTAVVVGHLVENKGQHLAIEALVSLPDLRLCVVGAGPQRGALEALARRLAVADRVSFCGEVEQGRLADYYSAADMLVLPSSREGSPNVVLEAMACGTPVVASAVGGIPEMVPTPFAGSLMPARTVAAIVAAVRDVAGRTFDRDALRRHAGSFSWSATTRGQIETFAAALGGACARAAPVECPQAGGGTAS